MATESGQSNTFVIVVMLAVGFVAVPTLASWAPELVNGLLILLLIGAILMNDALWLPYLAQFGNAVNTPPPDTKGTAA